MVTGYFELIVIPFDVAERSTVKAYGGSTVPPILGCFVDLTVKFWPVQFL